MVESNHSNPCAVVGYQAGDLLPFCTHGGTVDLNVPKHGDEPDVVYLRCMKSRINLSFCNYSVGCVDS